MTALRLASLLLGLATSCALLMCGAVLFAVSPWVGGVFWAAALVCWIAMWGSR